MKTPEEIKKGLDCCQTVVRCDGCTYKDIGNIVAECTAALCGDALAYIQKLEFRIAQIMLERDALMHDLSKCRRCETCENKRIPINKCPHFDGGTQYPCWQWRGPCPENTKEETK